MSECSALLDGYGRDFEAVNINCGAGVLKGAGGLRRNRVENDKRGLPGELCYLCGGADRTQIENGRAAGDEQQVCDFCSAESDIARMGSRVDKDDVCTAIMGGFKRMSEPRWRYGNNDRRVSGAAVLPFSGTGLRVDIDNDSAAPVFLSSDGEV